MTTATRIRRSPEQIVAFNKIVKKAVGTGAKGKKFPEIKNKLIELVGDTFKDQHVRDALNNLIESNDLTFNGKTRACTYFAA